MEQQSPNELAAAISNAVVATFREHLGKGPDRARTHLDAEMAVTVLRGGFVAAERTLRRAGREAVVERVRGAMRDVMERDLVARVQQLTGRRVEAFMSALHQDPELNLEIFIFAPDSDGAG